MYDDVAECSVANPFLGRPAQVATVAYALLESVFGDSLYILTKRKNMRSNLDMSLLHLYFL
jgi:hypothetical protein